MSVNFAYQGSTAVIDWTAVFTGTIAVLAALAAFWQVAILIWDKVIPKVEVRIQNLPHGGHYTASEEETFIFEMENKPRKSIFCGIKRKLTLHNVSVQMYFPARFTIVQVRWTRKFGQLAK